MFELLFSILGIALYIAFIVLCIGLFLFLIQASLFVGAVGGVGVGIWNGFKNYFSSLAEEIKLRK